MKVQMWSAISLACLGGTIGVTALGKDDADTVFKAFNDNFLRTPNGETFYRAALNNDNPDGTWTGSLDILVAEDAYDRTGDEDTKHLVEKLLNTWLSKNAPPWNWDGWNDDIGWFTLALIRGYQIAGNQAFLDNAKYGFDYAFGRGWNTTYNGGGIWEQNPEYLKPDQNGNTPKPAKEALSNDSLGKVACLIYQSTHDQYYLDRCRQIYDWVWNHLYDAKTGKLYTSIDEENKINTDSPVYSQGTFLDFAHILYKITLDHNVLNDATKAMQFGRQNLTANGIYSKSDNYLNTWADEMARGAGSFVRDHNLWDTYYSWMVDNANAILKNRRSDLGITWNGWDTATPRDNSLVTNKFASAVAWLQYTPSTKPDEIGGIHSIVNKKTGMAIDSAGAFGNGHSVIQWGPNGGINQKWQLTANRDGSWNIMSMSTWQQLDNPNSNKEDGATMVQWQSNRFQNQRWLIVRDSDGYYSISSQASGKVLDGASNNTNGAPLIQWGANNMDQQKWILN